MMLKWLLWIAAVPVAAGILVYAVGALLPGDHVARAEALVAAPVPRVASLVREVERHPDWRGAVTAVEVIERGDGGLRYIERSGGDAITFDFAEETPDRLFRSTIADPSLPFGGAWTIALSPEGNWTRVSIEERGSVRNPVYRFFSTLVFGHDSTMKAYLGDLQRAAGR
jgi:hypothetical protein